MDRDPIKEKEDFFEKLSSHDYGKGPLLVLAGPGTGKTSSLVKTIKTHVEKDGDLKTFYVTTLTNITVGHLESRICKEINRDFNNVSTLHYRAKGIIHRYADKIGLNKSFIIIDEPESKVILKDIQQKFLLDGEKVRLEEIKKMLKEHRKAKARSEDLEIGNFPLYYEGLKKFYNTIDWFDVIDLACKILKENTDILESEGSRQNFILVDEYQDLNPAEQNLIRLLYEKCSNLLVAGDDDQSIYSGRYANPSGIVNFEKIYRNAKKIHSSVSLRCPSTILKSSYRLINHNDKTKRELKPELIALPEIDKKVNGGCFVSVGLKSEKAEIDFIGKALETIIVQDKNRANNIMMLCVNRELGIELMNAIKKNYPNIPIHDDLSKDDPKNTQELIVSYLRRFLSNYYDNLALRMLLELLIKVPSERVVPVLGRALEIKGSLRQSLQQEDVLKQLKNKKEAVIKFMKCVKASEKKDDNETLLIFAREYPILKESIQRVIENSKSEHVVKDEEPRGISSTPVNGVRFMTMHSAKGLDADYVFIPFLEKEIRLPAKDTEEQRRLLYVAITRAKIAVIMTWAWCRKTAARHKVGGGGYMGRSRSNFVRECGIINDEQEENVLGVLKQLNSLEKK